jgi:hypothetical protein
LPKAELKTKTKKKMKTKTIFRTIIALFAFVIAGFSYANEAPEVSVAMAVALNELAEKELIKQFRHTGSWLARVPSKNNWVNNDVIKLTEIGADPAVLINNNTYPIAVSSRTDDSVAVSLYKYDTENTKITDDEVYALPYDKPGSVQAQHRETLEEVTEAHALHSLAPSGNSANTPIILTTGTLVAGRRRLISADLINYKKALDKLKIPRAGRCLVLTADHMADLLLEDKALEMQYHNHKEGAIAKNYYGFEIYESIFSPVYDASLDKIAYGAVTAGRAASVLFHAKTTAKARGTVTRYMGKAQDDPQNRETVVGFRLYFLAIPLRALGQGAIVDGTA